MPDAVHHLSMPTADFDSDLLPERARRVGSAEFMAETKWVLEQDFAAVGGQAGVEVGPEAIEVDWTPPPVGDARPVSAIFGAMFDGRLQAGELLLRLWFRSNRQDVEKVAPVAKVWFRSIPQFRSLSEAILRSAVAVAPESAAARKGWGIVCLQSGRLEAAFLHLRAATEQRADDPEAWLRFGDACTALGLMEEADEAYAKVIAADRWGLCSDEAAEKMLVSSAATMFSGRLRPAEWDSGDGWVPSRAVEGQVYASLPDWQSAETTP